MSRSPPDQSGRCGSSPRSSTEQGAQVRCCRRCAMQPRGGRKRKRGVGPRRRGAPIRRKDTIIASGFGADVPGFMPECSGKGLDRHVPFTEEPLHLLIDREFGRDVPPIPERRRSSDLAREFGDDRPGGPRENAQRAADLFQVRREAAQRMGQPPFRCAARRSNTRALLVKNEGHEHRPARPGRGEERRIVGEPQVVPKPDEYGTLVVRMKGGVGHDPRAGRW